ncbi:MAG: hypothetical protein KDB53_05020 [Planctomycetes bacterium]|nr:hypothetical protein [Planctomycetota bacterium]
MSQLLPLFNHANLDDRRLESIREAVRDHDFLAVVLKWCAASTPRRAPAAAVAQDEFTHDVIIPFDDGLYLAYDVT